MKTPPVDVAGRTLAHYRLVEKIGAGGMGVVYAAQDTHLDRIVAVKVLPAEAVADPERKRRFVQEAKSASALNHPNIIHIYDIDQSDGIDFMAMEHVPGRTLDELIGSKGLSLGTALKYAIQIADALAAAHAAGIVHRDLKPANIMVTDKGLVKVLDFGLAKLIESGPAIDSIATQTLKPLTEEGTVMGTSAYMSPEQVEGKKVDARSDIFAFGSVLYEMVTASRAFQGGSRIATLSAILHLEPKPIESVPLDLQKIIGRCLRKDPDRRFQHMADVRVVLDELKEESDSGKLAPPAREPALPLGRKRLKLWVPAAVGSVVLIGLLGTWKGGLFRPRSDGRSGPAQIRSIAVLPLENMSGDPAQDYFADGMTDAIITELGKVSGFERVIAWQSMKRYKGSTKSVGEIANEVNVDALVGGTVIREGNRVRISPNLIRIRPEKQLWAASYDRDLREILSLQSEVARAIALEVNIAVAGGAPGSSPGTSGINPEAYDLYLRGNHFLEQRTDESALRTSIQMYERATALDPNFAQAYSGLSRAHGWLWFNYTDRDEQHREAAKSSAEMALRLQPDSAYAHSAMGFVYYQGYLDYGRALEEFAFAQKINPNDSEVQAGIASVKRRQGKFQEALLFLEKATLLSPNFASHFFDLAVTYAVLRKYREAEPLFQRALSLKPDGQFYARTAWFALLAGKPDVARATLMGAQGNAARYQLIPYYGYQLELWTGSYAAAMTRLSSDPSEVFEWQWMFIPKAVLRAQVLALMGQPEPAREQYESARILLEGKLRAQPDDDRFYGSLGVAYAGLGRKKEAIEAGKKGMELCPMSKEAWRATFRMLDMARIYAMVGETDQAVNELDKVLSIPAEVSTAVLLADPLWAPLKNNPGFQGLIRKYSQ